MARPVGQAGLPGATPGQGLEPRSPRSERGVLPLDDPGSCPPSISRVARSAQRHELRTIHRRGGLCPSPLTASVSVPDGSGHARALARADFRRHVFHATRLPFDPGSRICTSYVEELWSRVLYVIRKNGRTKSPLCMQWLFPARERAEGLSLSGGASIQFWSLFKLSITLSSRRFSSETKKATLSGRPRFGLLCG